MNREVCSADIRSVDAAKINAIQIRGGTQPTKFREDTSAPYSADDKRKARVLRACVASDDAPRTFVR